MTGCPHISRPLALGMLLFLVAPGSRGQDSTRFRYSAVFGIVDTIIVAGNLKTQSYVILDEMTMKPGALVTAEAIQFDRNRIYSLGLFTSVDIFYDSLDTQRLLLVEVRERWYLIPIPILGARDGDPAKLFYGAGILHNNFLGKNQKLFGSIVLGFDPAVSFSFTDPLFDREDNLYFSFSLSTSSVRNRSLVESALTGDFDERHWDISGTVGRRLSLFSAAGINGGIHSVKTSIYRQGRTASTDGVDIYLYTTLQFAYDSRDLREYATRGAFFQVFFTKNGLGESDVDFSRLGLDMRKYIPLGGPLSFALRGHASVVSGSLIPTYARGYFGSGERIRGYYMTIWEGENLMGGTAELRCALFDTKTFMFSALPLPPEFSVWRFGVSLALFAETGLAWYRQDPIRLHSFASGYGAGVHFLLPYGYVLRTEYALDDLGKGQFILDLRGSI
jgi:outer membrane protein assembly factor BamA